MLKSLKRRTNQKLGLALMFSLGIIIVVFEIVRTIKSLGQSSFSEVAIYDIAENSVAIIVSSISTYRALWNTQQRRRKDSQYVHLKSPLKSGATVDSHRLDPLNSGASYTETLGEILPSESHYTRGHSGTPISVPEPVHV